MGLEDPVQKQNEAATAVATTVSNDARTEAAIEGLSQSFLTGAPSRDHFVGTPEDLSILAPDSEIIQSLNTATSLSRELLQSFDGPLQRVGTITGLDLSNVEVKPSPFEQPISLKFGTNETEWGTSTVLFVNTAKGADWNLPNVIASGIRADFTPHFHGMVESLGLSFRPEIAANSEALATALEKSLCDGTAVALVEAGVSYADPMPDREERLTSACNAFIENSQSLLKNLEGADLPSKAFQIASDVACSETLFNRALASGVSGEPLANLAALRTERLQQLHALDLGQHDENRLLKLFRKSAQLGVELPVNGDSAQATPGLRGLIREAGIHANSLMEYREVLISAFRGVEESDQAKWLPGGSEYQEINRQRARIGNMKFPEPS